jgi:hypothetical protein
VAAARQERGQVLGEFAMVFDEQQTHGGPESVMQFRNGA